MKNTLLVIVLFIYLLGCSSDDTFTDSRPVGFGGILQNTSQSQLSQIAFTVDLVFEDSLYLLADSLFDFEVYLNSRFWGSFTSAPIDTLAYRSVKLQNNLFSENRVEFLFVTNDQSRLDTLQTAGDYSAALRDVLSIQPGEYVAEIRSTSWRNTEGEIVKRPIRDLIPFTLEPNTNSLFIGNFITDVRP